MAVEIEVKIRVSEAAVLRAWIERLGFRVVRERRREQNWLFDDARGALRAAGAILRLEQNQTCYSLKRWRRRKLEGLGDFLALGYA